MKLQYDQPAIRKHLFEGSFGIEKESLRVYQDTGFCADTPHPFRDEHIVQDFAENQTEINTDIYPTWKEARAACEEMTCQMQVVLDKAGEVLWPFSNPSIIRSPEDLPMLKSGSESALDYRKYLERRYGRMKMAYSGIHYNFSFSEALLQAQFNLQHQESDYRQFKDRFYLDLCQKIVWYGWIIDILLNASPIFDGSLVSQNDLGKTYFSGMSSMRNSALGYWNFFTPFLDYSDLDAYTRSIEKYVEEGLLKAPRELYYPVRIKPAGSYSMEALRETGISHVELRMIDLNPYELSGISEEDAWFCHLLLVYLACIDDVALSWKDQIYAQQNFKNASFYQLEETRILFDTETSLNAKEAALRFLDEMVEFYASIDPDCRDLIRKQKLKLLRPDSYSLAGRVRSDFSDFAKDGLVQARWLQKKALFAKRSDL